MNSNIIALFTGDGIVIEKIMSVISVSVLSKFISGRQVLLIGVPKEIKTREFRVGLVPSSVTELVRRGHAVLIETQAGAGIGALKTGILGLGKEAAPAVEKAVETVTEAPSYFFDLVAKIKLFGKQRTTPSYKERVNEFTYTGKNGDQYELIEDLDTGEIMIQKDKMGVGVSGDKSFDVINDRTEMRYKKPKPDEGDPNPSEEYEEYKVEFDQDGTAADASQIDEISKKEIIEEVTEDAPSIKKASGGIAGMLGE